MLIFFYNEHWIVHSIPVNAASGSKIFWSSFIIFGNVGDNFSSVECHLCAELHSEVRVDAKNMNIA